MTSLERLHNRDHRRGGADPVNGRWYYVGDADTVPFENSWDNTGGGKAVARYGMDDDQIVIHGDVSGGVSGTVVFTLPVTHRPEEEFDKPGALSIAGALATVTVGTDGSVTITAGADATTVASDLAAHIGDTSDAHDASAISILDTAADFTATHVEGALAELQTADEADEAALAAHLADSTDAHDASAISILDTGTYFTATDVEGALAELGAGGGGGAPLGESWISAAGMWPSVTGGASGPNPTEMATNKQTIYTMDFADGSDLKSEWNFGFPSDWDGGTFTFQIKWLAAGTSTNSTVFGIEARSVGDNEAIDGAWGTQVTLTDAHTATADNQLISAASAAVTASGTPAGGEQVYFRLQRLASNGSDTLAQTVKVIGVQLNYTRT